MPRLGESCRIARPIYTLGGAQSLKVGDLVRLDRVRDGLALVTDAAGHVAQVPLTALGADTALTLPGMGADTGTNNLFEEAPCR
jgi:hypothetical protein